ncbi:HNH endonuclease [Variovorax sp. H27-G14]|uniref:HNH endonuclease n=1 Tax=Variovorax sp. H27-G14 TaxID=3111914 RepID=UPI0038FC7206
MKKEKPQQPIKFRAVHELTRWRIASHATLENALGPKSGAKALFALPADNAKIVKNGPVRFVIVWDSRNDDPGLITKPHTEPRQIRRKDIDRFEGEKAPPPDSVLDAYFDTAAVVMESFPVPVLSATTLPELEAELQERVRESEQLSESERLLRLANANPLPSQIQVTTSAFVRNADVIVQTLRRAKGQCERCEVPAPFLRAVNSSPYLEVHHVVPLSKGGEDTTSNTVALCPNCHRELHYGQAA